MWCQNCRQDAPGIAAAGGLHYTCARCGKAIPLSTLSARDAAGAAVEPLSEFDDWRWNEKLRRAEQAVRRQRGDDRPAGADNQWVIGDVARDPPGQWHPSRAVARHNGRRQGSAFAQAVSAAAWALLAVGLAAFVCGAVLSGWSLVSHRAELWDVGMPIALAGQLALLLGLILQLDRLGQDNRRQAEKLAQVGKQLDDLSGFRRFDPAGEQPRTPTALKAGLTLSRGSKNIPPTAAGG